MTQKHALYVGIDRYQSASVRDLRGSVADATAMKALLTDRFGFPADAPLLTDAQATRDGILAAFAALEARVGEGDQVVVFYAGHGSRAATAAGAKVEALVAHDSGRGQDPNRDVFDFEIDAFVGRLNAKTPWITLIMDCCHSGSVTRDVQAFTREVPAETRSLDSVLAARGMALPPAPGTGRYLPTLRSAVVLAACRADELASELHVGATGEYRGAFTWHLLQALDRVKGPARWLDVMRSLTPGLTARFSRQHPLVEGGADRQVFGGDLPPRPDHFAVVEARGDRCWIGGGAVQGVAAGSTWRLTDATRGEPRTAQVTGVQALRAELSAPEGAAPGWLAFPTDVTLPAPQLSVSVAAGSAAADPAAARLLDALADEHMLRRVDGEAEVRILALNTPQEAADKAPRLADATTPCWIALGPDGRLAAKPRPLAQGRLLAQDLALVARFNALVSLDFPDQAPDLAQAIDFELLDGATGAPLAAPFGDALPQVLNGQKVEFRITNRSPHTVYLSLVEFGSDREIKLLLPLVTREYHDGDHQGGYVLEAGQSVAVAHDYFGQLNPAADLSAGAPLTLPEGFPWAAEPGEALTVGALTLRLMVSREPQDFRFLTQRPTRGEIPPGLVGRLTHFHGGKGTRSFAIAPKSAAQGAAYAVLDRPLAVAVADGREISPSTGGRVRFYKMKAGPQSLGEVGITAPQMSSLPPEVGYWPVAPSKWPSVFELHPSDDVVETAAVSRLQGKVGYSNPTFGTAQAAIKAPAGTDAVWAVSVDDQPLAWVARAGSQLHWFTVKATPYLPHATLRFEAAALPAGKQAFSAVDKAL